MVINGVTRVEANEEKHIDADYVVLKGAMLYYQLNLQFVMNLV